MFATHSLAPIVALLLAPAQDSAPRTREILGSLSQRRFELDATAFEELLASGVATRLGVAPRGHAGGVRSVEIAPDGGSLLSCGPGGELKLWDAASGELAGTHWLVSDDDAHAAVTAWYLGDGAHVAVVWTDGTCRVSDANTLAEVRRFEVAAECADIRASRDGSLLVTVPRFELGGAPARARVFDASTGRAIGELGFADGVIAAASVSGDGRRIAIGGVAGSRRVVEVRERAGDALGAPLHAGVLASLVGEAEGRLDAALALSRDGRFLALGGTGEVKLVDLEQGKLLRTLDGDDASWRGVVTAVLFDATGERVFAGTSEGEVLAFDARTRRRLFRAPLHSRSVVELAECPDGSWLASASSDGSLRWLDAATGAERLVVAGASGPPSSLAFEPDGLGLVCGGRDGALTRWDLEAGEATRGEAEHPGAVLGLAFDRSAAGEPALCSASKGGVRRASEDGSAALSATHESAAEDECSAFAACADGSLFATGHVSGVARLWRGNEAIAAFGASAAGPAPPRAVALSADGASLAAIAHDGSWRAWRVDGERLLFESPAPASGAASPSGVAWIDGGRIVLASSDGTARIERVDGVTLCALEVGRDRSLGADAPVVAVAPGGTHVAALVRRHGLVVWNADDGSLALQVVHATPEATTLQFSADGARLAAGHADGTLTVWSLDELARWADASAGADAGEGAVAAGPPELGGSTEAVEAGVPRPDPDALRMRRRRVDSVDELVRSAQEAGAAGDPDVAEERLLRALAELEWESDAESRASRAKEIHARLAALPDAGVAADDAFAAAADAYVELARAYQRKEWLELAGWCLDRADVLGPGKGDRVRASVARAVASGGPAAKPAPEKPAPKKAAEPAAKAPPKPKPSPGVRPGVRPGVKPGAKGAKPGAAAPPKGTLPMIAPHAGWTNEGDRVLAKPNAEQPSVVLLDTPACEDAKLEIEASIEPGRARRNEFGVVFGASDDLGSAFALMVHHADGAKVVQAWLCDLRGGIVGEKIAQRKLSLDEVPAVFKLGVEISGSEVTLDVMGAARFTVPTDRPAHGRHGLIRTLGSDVATVFRRTKFEPAPMTAAAAADPTAPPRIAPDAPIDVRIAAAEAHVPFGAVEAAVAHLLRARRMLPYLADESLASEQAARIDALLEKHDPLHARREKARADTAEALVRRASARLAGGRPAAALAHLDLARLHHPSLAGEALESARPGLDLALEAKRGVPAEAPRALDNAELVRWFGAAEQRQELWVGGWSTIGASLASPILTDASTLLRATSPLPEDAREVSVEVRMENRGAAGLAFGAGEDGSFLAVTFDPESPDSSVTIARWTGAEGKGWDNRASASRRFSPEAMDGWTTIHVRLEGTRVTARVGRSEPVSATVPTRWTQGCPALLAIGQYGPQRVRFRNLVVRGGARSGE